MFRRFFIASSAVAAIALSAMGLAGIFTDVFFGFSLGGKFNGYLHSADGLLRLYMFSSEEDIYLSPTASGQLVSIHRDSDDALCARFEHASPTVISPYGFRWRDTINPRRRRITTNITMSGVRTWVYLPVAVLVTYPLSGVAIERWRTFRRPKERYCPSCDYDLTGNVSGICPECGLGITTPT